MGIVTTKGIRYVGMGVSFGFNEAFIAYFLDIGVSDELLGLELQSSFKLLTQLTSDYDSRETQIDPGGGRSSMARSPFG